MKWMVSYDSNIGKRQKNEDSLFIKIADTNIGQIVFSGVCDGAGGLDNGALASEVVTSELAIWFNSNIDYLVCENFSSQNLFTNWKKCIVNINKKLLKYGENRNLKLGTTMSAILLINGKYYAMHVGDSRIYQISDRVEQITEDQSLVARELKTGLITTGQARADTRKNIILQCIGSTVNINPVFYEGNIKKNSVVLLCSDGFIHEVSDEELGKYFAFDVLTDEKIMKEHIEKVIELVQKRDEKDNVSVVLIKPVSGER